jgi:hypothetical protein
LDEAMTLCAVIINNGVVQMLTDTLETVPGKPEVTPQNKYTGQDIAAVGNARLVRKVLKLDETTVVCFAGRPDQIIEFSQNMDLAWRAASETQRNTKFLERLHRGTGLCPFDLQMIAVNTKPENFSVFCCGGFEQDFAKIGKVYAIGSGAEEFLKTAKSHDLQIPNFAVNQPEILALEVLRYKNQVNCRKFFQYPSSPSEGSWGGFIEQTYFDHLKRIWVRDEQTAYFQFEVVVQDGMIFFRPGPRAFFYSVSNDFSWGAVGLFMENEPLQFWRIDDLLQNNMEHGKNSITQPFSATKIVVQFDFLGKTGSDWDGIILPIAVEDPNIFGAQVGLDGSVKVKMDRKTLLNQIQIMADSGHFDGGHLHCGQRFKDALKSG